MKYLFVTPDGLPSKWLEASAIGTFLSWFIFAALVPVFTHINDWDGLQDVWDRWQTLNTGMLAFLASFLALSSARVGNVMAARRNFRATIPALTHTLSTLYDYSKISLTLIGRAYPNLARIRAGLEDDELPVVKESELDSLKDIVRYAPSNISDFVSRLIIELQVFDARIRGMERDRYREAADLARLTGLYYVLSFATVKARLNYLFGFARGELKVFDEALTYDQIVEALPIGCRTAEDVNLPQDQWRNMINRTVERANQPLNYGFMTRENGVVGGV